jgi:hypothetical protein
VLPLALRLYDGWSWLAWLLVGVGAVLLLTDVFFSTKVSDWKRVIREFRTRSG